MSLERGTQNTALFLGFRSLFFFAGASLAPGKNEHVLTHVPSKLPSLLTSLLNSSTGLRAYGSGPLLRKRGLYNMCSWNLGEKGSAQFSHCAMLSASCFLAAAFLQGLSNRQRGNFVTL